MSKNQEATSNDPTPNWYKIMISKGGKILKWEDLIPTGVRITYKEDDETKTIILRSYGEEEERCPISKMFDEEAAMRAKHNSIVATLNQYYATINDWSIKRVEDPEEWQRMLNDPSLEIHNIDNSDPEALIVYYTEKE